MTTTNADLLKALRDSTTKTGKLVGVVSDLRDELSDLSDYAQRSRRFIRLLLASLIFDLVLSVLLGAVGVVARNTAIDAKAATTASKVASNNLKVICEAGNDSNATNRKLWDSILAIPAAPVPGQTPAQKVEAAKVRAKFILDTHKAFAQKDCR